MTKADQSHFSTFPGGSLPAISHPADSGTYAVRKSRLWQYIAIPLVGI